MCFAQHPFCSDIPANMLALGMPLPNSRKIADFSFSAPFKLSRDPQGTAFAVSSNPTDMARGRR